MEAGIFYSFIYIFLEMPFFTLRSHLNSVTAHQLFFALGHYQFVIVVQEERLGVTSCNTCKSEF